LPPGAARVRASPSGTPQHSGNPAPPSRGSLDPCNPTLTALQSRAPGPSLQECHPPKHYCLWRPSGSPLNMRVETSLKFPKSPGRRPRPTLSPNSLQDHLLPRFALMATPKASASVQTQPLGPPNPGDVAPRQRCPSRTPRIISHPRPPGWGTPPTRQRILRLCRGPKVRTPFRPFPGGLAPSARSSPAADAFWMPSSVKARASSTAAAIPP
jgi:hypothetical protein